MAIQIKCALKFDRSDPVFFSGELVKGIVHLESESDLTYFRNKHVELIGICKTNWHKKHSVCEATFQFYTSFAWHLEEITNNTPNEIGSFQQQFRFKFHLLNQFPTSCKAKHGSIEYEIVFVMQHFEKYEDTVTFKHTQPITVIRTLNPNNFVLYKACWQFDPIPLLSCIINQTSYVPGENINFLLTLKNQFMLYFIKSITISLQELIEYRGFSKYFKKYELLPTRQTLNQFDINTIEQQNNSPQQEFGGTLNIPKTTVTSFNYPIYPLYDKFCITNLKIRHVINIKVTGRFTVKFSKAGYDKSITIATEPMIKHNGETITCDISKEQVEKSTPHYYFECLPYTSNTSSPEIAFIPKHSMKEETNTVHVEYNVFKNEELRWKTRQVQKNENISTRLHTQNCK